MINNDTFLAEMLDLLQIDHIPDRDVFARIEFLLQCNPKLASAHGGTFKTIVDSEMGIVKEIRSNIPLIIMAIINDFIPWSIVELFLQYGADIKASYNISTVSQYCIQEIFESNIVEDVYGVNTGEAGTGESGEHFDPFIIEQKLDDKWQPIKNNDMCLPIIASKYHKLRRCLE